MGTKANPAKFDCYSRAEPDEPMFVLLGRDHAASVIVLAWVGLRRVLGHTEPAVLDEAVECARAMRDWARAKGKNPDAVAGAYVVLTNFSLLALLARARAIWGPEKLDANGVLVRLMVDVGKLARYVRGSTKDKPSKCPYCAGGLVERCGTCGGTGKVGGQDVRVIMGNILFSMIRWCDDLGLDLGECCTLAAEQQQKFADANQER